MKDYREHVGKEISVMTRSGTFIGELLQVGRDTLTLRATAYFTDSGEPAGVPQGRVILDRFAIDFVQVK